MCIKFYYTILIYLLNYTIFLFFLFFLFFFCPVFRLRKTKTYHHHQDLHRHHKHDTTTIILLLIMPNPNILFKVMLCVDQAWILQSWMVTCHRTVFHSWLVAPESCHWLGQAWTHGLVKTNEQEQESVTYKGLELLTKAETSKYLRWISLLFSIRGDKKWSKNINLLDF